MAEDKAAAPKTEEKKEKAPKEVKKIPVKSSKANSTSSIDPRTGTRFVPNSARQLAFEIVLKLAKARKNAKDIREVLGNTRKDKGAAFNLDVGYLNYVVACHPEMFEAYSDGAVKVISEPKVDAEAAKKFEEEREAKKKKAETARAARKEKGAEGAKAEKSEKAADKPVTKAEDKPSKKEKD